MSGNDFKDSQSLNKLVKFFVLDKFQLDISGIVFKD